LLAEVGTVALAAAGVNIASGPRQPQLAERGRAERFQDVAAGASNPDGARELIEAAVVHVPGLHTWPGPHATGAHRSRPSQAVDFAHARLERSENLTKPDLTAIGLTRFSLAMCSPKPSDHNRRFRPSVHSSCVHQKPQIFPALHQSPADRDGATG